MRWEGKENRRIYWRKEDQRKGNWPGWGGGGKGAESTCAQRDRPAPGRADHALPHTRARWARRWGKPPAGDLPGHRREGDGCARGEMVVVRGARSTDLRTALGGREPRPNRGRRQRAPESGPLQERWLKGPPGAECGLFEREHSLHGVSLVAQLVKNPHSPAMRETWVPSPGWEDAGRRERLPTPVFWPGESLWTVSSMRSQRVGHDWATFTFSSCAEGQGKRTDLKTWTPLGKPSAQAGTRKSWRDGTAKDNAPGPNLEALIHRQWNRWLRKISPEKEQIFWHFRPRYWFVVVANKRAWFRYVLIQISFPAHAGSTTYLITEGKWNHTAGSQ